MSKITKTIAALGVVAGLGVAALPLASYAVVDRDTQNITVNATVGNTISLTMADDKTSVSLEPVAGGAIDSDTVTAQVTTNNSQGYTLSASAETSTLSSGDDTIAAGTPTASGSTSYWGIQGGDVLTYQGLSSSSTQLKKTDAENPSSADKIAITIGVNAASTQPTGTYTGSFTLTAAVNAGA